MEIRLKASYEGFEWFDLLVQMYAYYRNLSMFHDDLDIIIEEQAIYSLLKEFHDVGEL